MSFSIKSLGLAAVGAVLLCDSLAQAQFNTECPAGEQQLYVKVLGTDRLSNCKDYFDNVDPYAVVTVGDDQEGTTKMTKRLDNNIRPEWNAVLNFGCQEKDTRIALRVKDYDFFGDELCLGPLVLTGPWPESGVHAEVCEEEDLGMGSESSGCLSFILYYPDETSATATDLQPPSNGPEPHGTTTNNPIISNGATTRDNDDSTTSSTPPSMLPPVMGNDGSPGASTVTEPSTASSSLGAPAPTIDDASEDEESSKESNNKHHRKTKTGAAVAGSIIGILAVVGVGAGIALVFARRQRSYAPQLNEGEAPSITPGNAAVTGGPSVTTVNLQRGAGDGISDDEPSNMAQV